MTYLHLTASSSIFKKNYFYELPDDIKDTILKINENDLNKQVEKYEYIIKNLNENIKDLYYKDEILYYKNILVIKYIEDYYDFFGLLVPYTSREVVYISKFYNFLPENDTQFKIFKRKIKNPSYLDWIKYNYDLKIFKEKYGHINGNGMIDNGEKYFIVKNPIRFKQYNNINYCTDSYTNYTNINDYDLIM